jgi:DNA-binding HxlR family transcriptional regulator
VTDDDSIMRQRARDAEYVAACRAHGIKPDAPSYMAPGIVIEAEAADNVGRTAGPTKNGGIIRTHADDPEPLKELTPEAEAAGRVIDLLVPIKSGAKEFVRTAGRRALALAWILGRRPEPLAELARQLGVSRASLSTYVRTLEDKTGVHGRGQKGASTRATYAATAKQGWKVRRVNKLMADAVAE